MAEILSAPRKLEKGDDRSGFSCGVLELDEWFGRFAWESLRANNAVTYVTTWGDSTVAGYYALCSAGISREHAPVKFAMGRPKDIPCVLLARLAVDQRFQGRAVGRHLFRDAILKAVNASDAIGAACLLIHARDEAAKNFHLRHAPMQESPLEPLHLVLPMKQARRALGF